jgi:TIR domain
VKPAERIPLLKKLAAALAADHGDETNLVLRQFGFSSGDIWGTSGGIYLGPDAYGYAFHHLENSGSDEALQELERYLDPSSEEGSPTPISSVPGPWKKDTFHLFISHTHPHAGFAGTMRSYLAKYRIDAFVAHDTIAPSEEWRQTIETALLTCHAAAALMTVDFRESMWCDQEVGYCLARGVLVLPVMIDATPHGFLGKYQAVKVKKGRAAMLVAQDVFRVLAVHAETRERMAPAVVRRFAKSTSFESARDGFALLRRIPKDAWTKELVDEVDKAVQKNIEVKNANYKNGDTVPGLTRKLLAPVRKTLGLDEDWLAFLDDE